MDSFSPSQKRSVESAEDWDIFDAVTVDVDFRHECRGIVAGVSGSVGVVMLGGTPSILPPMPDGFRYDVVGIGLVAADTTATNIIVYY